MALQLIQKRVTKNHKWTADSVKSGTLKKPRTFRLVKERPSNKPQISVSLLGLLQRHVPHPITGTKWPD